MKNHSLSEWEDLKLLAKALLKEQLSMKECIDPVTGKAIKGNNEKAIGLAGGF